MGHRVETGHRNARHRFDTGAEIGLAGAHLQGAAGHVNGLHGRSAEAVDGHPGDAQGQLGQEADQPGHVETLLAFGKGAADDQVFDFGRVDAGALQQPADNLGRHLIGANAGQFSLEGGAKGRPGIAGNDDGDHGVISSLRRGRADSEGW